MALLVQVGRDVWNKTALYGVGIVNIRGKEGDRIGIPWAQRVHGSDVEWPLQYTRRMCIVIYDPQSDVLSNKALIEIHQNTLQTEPLLLRMGIRKHILTMIAAETCARHMWASCPMEPCVQAHATGAQHAGFSTNLSPYTSSIRPYTSRYTAVYSEVYGRILVVYGAH